MTSQHVQTQSFSSPSKLLFIIKTTHDSHQFNYAVTINTSKVNTQYCN